jgi:hypothetical protein
MKLVPGRIKPNPGFNLEPEVQHDGPQYAPDAGARRAFILLPVRWKEAHRWRLLSGLTFFVLALQDEFMDYSLMTTFYVFLAALLICLNTSGSISQASSSSFLNVSDKLERLGRPPGYDPADNPDPGWARNLDANTIEQVRTMDDALQKYIADHNLATPLPKTLTLDDLVTAKYLKEIPPAPAGRKFAISHLQGIVVLIPNQ